MAKKKKKKKKNSLSLVITDCKGNYKEELISNYFNGKLLVVYVGSDKRPATTNDIDDIRGQLKKVLSSDCRKAILVTHHNVHFETFIV